MGIFYRFVIWGFMLLPVFGFAETKLKIDNKNVAVGESLNYKATWGFLTIGSARTKIDPDLHKIGSKVCYKIDIEGKTNGVAKLFYLHDQWQSYIDTATITTHKSSRSIREGHYALDEQVHFDAANRKAEVKVYNKKTKEYVLKKVYDTPENIRDVVAGFMVFRLVDLSRYTKGETFTVNGFYEDEGYKINVIYQGKETIKTDRGNILCYRMRPIVPKNHVFEGKDAVIVWLSADKYKTIIRIRAKMFVGNIWIDLQ